MATLTFTVDQSANTCKNSGPGTMWMKTLAGLSQPLGTSTNTTRPDKLWPSPVKITWNHTYEHPSIRSTLYIYINLCATNTKFGTCHLYQLNRLAHKPRLRIPIKESHIIKKRILFGTKGKVGLLSVCTVS